MCKEAACVSLCEGWKQQLVIKGWTNKTEKLVCRSCECSFPLTCSCECIPEQEKLAMAFFPFLSEDKGSESEWVIELIMFYHLLAD